MTNKKKIHQILSSLWKNDDSVGKTYYNQALQDVQTAVDLQEEPVNRTPADVESAMQEVEEKSRVFTEAHQGEDTDTILAQMRGEEPVSDGLEKAAKAYSMFERSDDTEVGYDLNRYDGFIAGAKWQEELFEKKRLAHCDALTKEQAQIESDFVINHLKKNNRTPTFIDAIEYGMALKEKDESTTEDLGNYINELSKQFPEVSFAKLSRITVRVAKWQKKQDQSTIELAEDHAMLAGMEKMKEEMMAKAVDGEVGYWNQRGLSVLMNLPSEFNEDDKCKIILIKED